MLHRFTSYEMSTTLENGAVIEGGKTGFTDEAGQCLVSFAEYGGRRVHTRYGRGDDGFGICGGQHCGCEYGVWKTAIKRLQKKKELELGIFPVSSSFLTK